jgi:NAD(P)-dependent dehydrogenase (short-subunit alcohol dehydrogenase family)
MTRTALVTGASRGIGLATAKALAAAGWRVFATSRAPDASAPLVEAARVTSIETMRLDVGDERSVREAVSAVVAKIGDVPDLVVSNAGTGVVGALEEVSEAELRAVVETNFLGAARVARAVVGPMRARGHGRIVHVGSIGGRVAVPGIGAYSASKSALAALNDTLRRELAPFGVDVVLVEPGAVKTDLIGPGRPVAERTQDPGSPYRLATELIARSMQLNFVVAAMPAERVAQVVLRAATSRRPRPRYLVGLDAHLLAAFAWLPSARAQDALLAALFERVMAVGSLRADRSEPAPRPSPPATVPPAWRTPGRASS